MTKEGVLPFESICKASLSSDNPYLIEYIIDLSLNLEDTHYKVGYSDGYSNGLASGRDEGREVWLKSGFEMGEELGYYRGFFDVWNAAIVVQPNSFLSYSVIDIVYSLRLKFRAICAMLNVKLEYNGYPIASDVENLGF
ncbi:hypothetical protein R3W88_000765 [Solanum pinnatisectum]|uniref:Essential protein Yae1 N-terminal domain-containing protein n=1 Tax=Solanum pinnatisectum TaxID=50273 RepID=A0AAV9MI07_9SOLN|nr:hypothetical protein R3W88_000765 [Solanum pinnatisectum]